MWKRAEAEETATDDEAALQVLLAQDPEALLVATLDAQLVGTVIGGWNGWRGSIYRLAVLPEHRRRGIGRRLIEEAERRLRARGARRIDAVVTSTRDEATAFWAAVGFQAQEDRTRFVKNVTAPS